jgi:dTMP kinase
MEKGKLIAFEGIDASGKATQAKLLYEFLKSKNIDCIATDEPVYKGPIGQKIKELLHSKLVEDAFTLQLIFTADRACHVASVIAPALEQGKLVISDRYLLSTIAFSVGRDLDAEKLESIKKANTIFPYPDIIFVLNIGQKEAVERINQRSKEQNRNKDMHEKDIQFLLKVKNAYIELQKEYKNIFIINGNGSIEEVKAEILRILERELDIK